MTRQEFETWIEQRGNNGKKHYDELLEVAYQRTRTDGGKRRRDSGQAAAADAVQSAVTRALDSETFAAMRPENAWPWLVRSVESALSNTRRGSKRASRALREWSGVFHLDYGKHTPSWTDEEGNPLRKRSERSGRIVAVDQYQNDDGGGHGYIGPRAVTHADRRPNAKPGAVREGSMKPHERDWRGEYTVAHLGRCSCRGESWSRWELGADRERRGYSKRWTVEALLAIERAVKDAPEGSLERLAGYALACVAADAASHVAPRSFQVLGCLNGHRTYTGEVGA